MALAIWVSQIELQVCGIYMDSIAGGSFKSRMHNVCDEIELILHLM